MRVLVLGPVAGWHVRDLQRAAADRCEIVTARYEQLSARLVDRQHRVSIAGRNLNEFDAVLLRTLPAGSLEQVIFRMDVLGGAAGQGSLLVNAPRAVETAVDKYLTSARLLAAGLPVPRTLVCENSDEAIQAFHELGGDVVLKPLFGSEGRGIMRLNDESLAQRTFSLLAPLGAVFYLQEFIEHEGHDLRVLTLGENALAMRRSNPHDWRTNISRGATGEAASLDEATLALARRATAAVGARMAGVDLLRSRCGKWFVLEVNAVPGWRALSAVHQTDVAAGVLEFLRSEVLTHQSVR